MVNIAIQPTFKEILDHWILLIDTGEYKKSWAQAAKYFQEHITEGEWVRAITQVRQTLGAPHTRKLTSATHTPTIANMPVGEYLVAQYHSVFAKYPIVTETITLINEELGWRVVGYYLR